MLLIAPSLIDSEKSSLINPRRSCELTHYRSWTWTQRMRMSL
jgi:hypothetical protein